MIPVIVVLNLNYQTLVTMIQRTIYVSALKSILVFSALVANVAAETVLSKPTYDTELIAELDSKISDKTYQNINGIVVMRDGNVLFERYYNGSDENTLHNPRSVGKTFASTMAGIALRDGYLTSLDQTLDEFYDLKKYANYSERKAKVTLRQLLTMTSGFDGFDFEASSIGNEENMYPQDNWVKWTLDLPMATNRNPGEKWFYFTAGIVVLGDILHKVLPGGLEAYTQKTLFTPLGIEDFQWQYTPQGVANTAGGLQLSARDFAKFGQLYKNQGVWNAEQILPAAFIAESLKNQAATTDENSNYGYLWWKTSFSVDGKNLPISYCSGNGGNKIYVFETQSLVISITASAYGQSYAHRQVNEMMEKYILPAVLTNN